MNMQPSLAPPGMWPSWLEIIVPARNEERRLPAGLAMLSAKAMELPPGVTILVVDSASTDSTPDIVRRWPEQPVPVRLISCEQPGKGAAVRTGLLASSAPFVGFCDADMATDLSALDGAVGLLRQGHKVVIGSRAHAASEVQVRHSVLRRLGAITFRAMARQIASGVQDTQCGFKFFSGPIARAAAKELGATGFAFDIELIARCQLLGAEPVEIPVLWRDVPGSRFSVARHSLPAFYEAASIWTAIRAHRRALIPAQREAGPLSAHGVVRKPAAAISVAAAGDEVAAES
jgi:dolichyl-phosphate beta-glucosyltransferase